MFANKNSTCFLPLFVGWQNSDHQPASIIGKIIPCAFNICCCRFLWRKRLPFVRGKGFLAIMLSLKSTKKSKFSSRDMVSRVFGGGLICELTNSAIGTKH